MGAFFKVTLPRQFPLLGEPEMFDTQPPPSLHLGYLLQRRIPVWDIKKVPHHKMRYLTADMIRMVGVTGFEPAASWSRTKRSTELSHTPIYLI